MVFWILLELGRIGLAAENAENASGSLEGSAADEISNASAVSGVVSAGQGCAGSTAGKDARRYGDGIEPQGNAENAEADGDVLRTQNGPRPVPRSQQPERSRDAGMEHSTSFLRSSRCAQGTARGPTALGRQPCWESLRSFRWIVPVAGCVLFITALLWAGAREPFERVEFWLRTEGGAKTKAMAVMPKGGGPFPVVAYSHSHGKNLLRSGNELRMLAEQGMAAVGFEYDQTNQAGFDSQMTALVEQLPRLKWADTNSMAWAGSSLGANRQLSFLLRHPERQPGVLVRIAGGWRGVKSEIRDSKSEGAEVGSQEREIDGDRLEALSY
jgi:hypothetical protein